MVAPFNPNLSKVTKNYSVAYPRDLGRGNCLDSAGQLKTVSWLSGQVFVNGVFIFNLTEQPAIIDLSVDGADRPVICWQDQAGNGFVRFFDPVPNDYSIYNCGQLSSITICNDFTLTNNNIALVYLVNQSVYYRAHSEKFVTVRQLENYKMRNIDFFGRSTQSDTNSLVAVGFLIQ